MDDPSYVHDLAPGLARVPGRLAHPGAGGQHLPPPQPPAIARVLQAVRIAVAGCAYGPEAEPEPDAADMLGRVQADIDALAARMAAHAPEALTAGYLAAAGDTQAQLRLTAMRVTGLLAQAEALAAAADRQPSPGCELSAHHMLAAARQAAASAAQSLSLAADLLAHAAAPHPHE